MKNILITGGAGFIGTNISLTLLEKGYNVVVVDDLKNAYKKHINKLLKNFDNLAFYKGDVCDFDFMDKVCGKHDFDTVLHLAAKKYVFESIVHPISYKRNNMKSLENMMRLSEKYNINKFMFASSITVLGNNAVVDGSEKCEYAPVSPYAETKMEGEKELLLWHHKNKEKEVLIFRFTNPISANTEFMLGDNSKLKKVSLPAFIVEGGLKQEKMKFNGNNHSTPDGTPVRDYIHITDLARIVCACLEKDLVGKAEIINVGCGGNGYSVLEIVKEVETCLGRKLEYTFGEKKKGDVAKLVCDNTKIKTEFNLSPTRSLHEDIEDEIKYRKYLLKKDN